MVPFQTFQGTGSNCGYGWCNKAKSYHIQRGGNFYCPVSVLNAVLHSALLLSLKHLRQGADFNPR